MPKMNPAVLVADTPLRSRFATVGQAMDDDEVCELYASAPSTMHQPLYMDAVSYTHLTLPTILLV